MDEGNSKLHEIVPGSMNAAAAQRDEHKHPHREGPSPFDVRFNLRDGLTAAELPINEWRCHIALQLPDGIAPSVILLRGVEAGLRDRHPFTSVANHLLMVMFSVEDETAQAHALKDEVTDYLAGLLHGSIVVGNEIINAREEMERLGEDPLPEPHFRRLRLVTTE